jgi:hypothetical protein
VTAALRRGAELGEREGGRNWAFAGMEKVVKQLLDMF